MYNENAWGDTQKIRRDGSEKEHSTFFTTTPQSFGKKKQNKKLVHDRENSQKLPKNDKKVLKLTEYE